MWPGNQKLFSTPSRGWKLSMNLGVLSRDCHKFHPVLCLACSAPCKARLPLLQSWQKEVGSRTSNYVDCSTGITLPLSTCLWQVAQLVCKTITQTWLLYKFVGMSILALDGTYHQVGAKIKYQLQPFEFDSMKRMQEKSGAFKHRKSNCSANILPECGIHSHGHVAARWEDNLGRVWPASHGLGKVNLTKAFLRSPSEANSIWTDASQRLVPQIRRGKNCY